MGIPKPLFCKTLLAIILTTILLMTAVQAAPETEKYLFSCATETPLHVTEVMFRPNGASFRSVFFADKEGVLDMASFRVRGKDLQGEDVSIPLDTVSWVRVKYEADDQTRFVALRLNAVLDRSEWLPRGYLARVILHGGTGIEFDGMEPELRPDTREIVWSGADDCEVHLPFINVFWVEFIRPNSSVNKEHSIHVGELKTVVLRSGAEVDLVGRNGCFDVARDQLRCDDPPWSTSLGEVRLLRVGAADQHSPLLPGRPSEVPFELLGNLPKDQRIRVKAGSGEADWITGSFTGYENGEIFLLAENDTTITLTASDVFALQVSEGHQPNRLLNAAAVGVLLGAVLYGMSAVTDIWGTQSSEDHMKSAKVGLVIGGVLGLAGKKGFGSERFKDLQDFEKPNPVVEPDDELRIGYAIRF